MPRGFQRCMPKAACVVLLLAAPWPVAAGETPPALTLAEARRLALERGWPLLAARADARWRRRSGIAARAFQPPAQPGGGRDPRPAGAVLLVTR
jgi:hypothetical protein